MPDFSNCERDEYGNSYCYDQETGQVYLLRFEIVPEKKVPPEIWKQFFVKEFKKNKSEGGSK